MLIIDEINRGNISRIFGELITLIEPSKRSGAAEALEVTLPLTGDRFSVPDNLYIIGTMNTADRSLAGLDLALRRRFAFIEMPPLPEELNGVSVDGIDVEKMRDVINRRITALLDKDHCIGHAYFIHLKDKSGVALTDLAEAFKQKIIPLLQEYF
ncbi:MAG: AAA family ATPase, partial [Vibrio sp.]|uniref:AAA family ATPase n=1 Tax=Vibrio sp. TaxID=678 RepID=UPI001EB82496|nr:AAA family ATPase [Vibrio sp.]